VLPLRLQFALRIAFRRVLPASAAQSQAAFGSRIAAGL
jgi:hypothetical protein